MRLFRRRHQHPQVTVIVDGSERPVWALRAGQLIVGTDYDVGARRMTLRVVSDANVTQERRDPAS